MITVASAQVNIIIDDDGKVKLMTKETFANGKIDGPSIKLELDPMDVLHLLANGVGDVVHNAFGKGKKQ